MTDGQQARRPDAAAPRGAPRPRPVRAPRIAWPLLLAMSGGFWLMTTILLWFGAAVAVRCERVTPRIVRERPETRDGATVTVVDVVQEGRVDVIAEQRLVGLLAVRSERLPDVVKAGTIRRSGGPRRGLSGGVGAQLQLTLRDGRTWESMPEARQIAGTRAREMAARIQEFLDRSTEPSLRLRWIPWLMNALAVPMLLVSGLFAMACVNTLRRALGLGGPMAP